ncbi:hypothetical protein J3458_005629 [Metarhizium acridum]|uniref:uncharacterized protein n=1 Tax=Metarhizium acridum TaxID=92637 RepID=UPI001C6CC341|nr:hypothetical protein J3458_005629 [Metarhizium acridum]
MKLGVGCQQTSKETDWQPGQKSLHHRVGVGTTRWFPTQTSCALPSTGLKKIKCVSGARCFASGLRRAVVWDCDERLERDEDREGAQAEFGEGKTSEMTL